MCRYGRKGNGSVSKAQNLGWSNEIQVFKQRSFCVHTCLLVFLCYVSCGGCSSRRKSDELEDRTRLDGPWKPPAYSQPSARDVLLKPDFELYRVYGHDARLEPFLNAVANFCRRTEVGVYLAVLDDAAAAQIASSGFACGMQIMSAKMKVPQSLQGSLDTSSTAHDLLDGVKVSGRQSYIRASMKGQEQETSSIRDTSSSSRTSLFVLVALKTDQVPALLERWRAALHEFDSQLDLRMVQGGKLVAHVSEDAKDGVIRWLASQTLVRWVEERHAPVVRNKWATKVKYLPPNLNQISHQIRP